MTLNLIFPTLEALVFTGIRILKRQLDQRKCCPVQKFDFDAKEFPKMKVTTMQKFEEIYSGPVFNIHYRIAYIINIIFICFFYGPG